MFHSSISEKAATFFLLFCMARKVVLFHFTPCFLVSEVLPTIV